MSAIDIKIVETVKQADTSPTLHLMIDFESLGLRPNSVILSAGVCSVPPNLVPEAQWYGEFDALEQEGDPYNRVTDPNTLSWWMTQGDMPQGELSLKDGIISLQAHLYNLAQQYKLELWANGTDFDIPLFYNALDQHNCPSPFKYDAVRDYRTMRKAFWEVPSLPFQGKKHHALDDAKNQAAHLNLIFDHIQKLRGITALSGIT
jgi:hypothetical protein